jgi:long-chain acyl-CoA synthetase
MTRQTRRRSLQRAPRIVPSLEDKIETLVELLEQSVAWFGDRAALSMRRADGTLQAWTYRELDRRARLAAWRLRALGLEPGQRVLTWSPSCPELAATYFGAMRARLILVPLDLRMSPDAVLGFVRASEPARLLLGTGRDAPDPREVDLAAVPTTTVDALCDEPDATFPPDWETQARAWARPAPGEVFELIFTSGTTGTPKGVMLGHDNVTASVRSFSSLVPPMEHRLVSLLPLSHLLEQSVGLFYTLSVGADIHYLRSRNPRVIFDSLRERRITSMVLVPQVIDLFWSGIEREVERRGRLRLFNRLRSIARWLPMGLRRLLFRSVHAQLGGGLRLFLSAGAFLAPAVQQAWEDIGVTILQGYGATETGTGCCTTLQDHGLGTVGRPAAGAQIRIAEDHEILFKGPTLFHGYWNEPDRTRAAFTADGWYRTGDIGQFDAAGRLVLSGRKTDMIVLPNGFNVYPEDIENALREAGMRDSVVLETRPGRIEAVVLWPGTAGGPSGDGSPDRTHGDAPAAGAPSDVVGADLRAEINRILKVANGRLGANQHIDGWRLWPDEDFPRTHTLKVRRDRVRAWVAVEGPLAIPGDHAAGDDAAITPPG